MNSVFTRAGQTIYSPSGAAIPGGKGADGAVATLNAGDVSAAIVFNAVFTTPPAVTGQILLPDGSSAGIPCWPDESTRTVSGVTFRFGAAVPASGYKLSWSAIGS